MPPKKRWLSDRSDDSNEENNVYKHSLSQPSIEIEDERELPPEETLEQDTLKLIKLDFSVILTALCQSLKRHNINAQSLLGHLRSIEAIGPNFEPLYIGNSQPLKAVSEQNFETMEDLLAALAPYCSWFNHLLIENIMETFCEGDKALERKWMKFKEKLKVYCERRVIDCPEDQYGEDNKLPSRDTWVMKVDYNWRSIKINQLYRIHDSAARILKIRPFNLYLRTVENGCVKMLFYVPDHVVIEVTDGTKDALKGISVLYLVYVSRAMEKAPSPKRLRPSSTIAPTVHQGMFGSANTCTYMLCSYSAGGVD